MSTVIGIHDEESEVTAFEYVNAMPLAATAEAPTPTIASAELSAHEWINGKVGEEITDDFLVDADGHIVETQVRFQFQNPEAGKLVRVKTKTTFSDGQVKVNRLFFEVTPA